MAVTAVVALTGLGLAAYGAYEKSQAVKAAKNNTMPAYQIPQEEQDNLRLAQSYASQGMGAGAYQAYMNNADRRLASTNNAILMGGGNANAIGAAQDKYQQGISNLAIYDDQARQQHLSTLMAQTGRMGAFKDKQYQINDYGKWANDAQLYAAQQQGANQTMGQGIGIAASAGAQFGKSLGGDDNSTPSPQSGPTTANYGQVPFQSAQNNMGSYSNANSFAGSQRDANLPTYEPYYAPAGNTNGNAGASNYGWTGYMSSFN